MALCDVYVTMRSGSQVLSEKRELSKTEWLGRSHEGSSMTSESDVVVYGALWTLCSC
jgi:hypothetical protein